MPHTKDFKLAYKDEAAFASGHGSTANTPEELVLADLTAIDRMVSFNAGIPKPTREELFSLASGLTPDAVITNNVISPGGSLSAYFQTDDLYDWAMSPTLGTTGTSKAFRYNSPFNATEKDLYGCLCTKWELDLQLGKAIMQNVDFMPTQAKTASITPIATTGIPAFSTAAPKTFKDVVLSVDTLLVATQGFSSLKYTVENTFASEDDAMDLSSFYLLNPVLVERDISFEIGFNKRGTETWDEDELNTTVQTIASVLNLSLFTLTLANYNVWETNQDAFESRGIIKRTAKFKRGVASTQAKS